MVEDYGDVADDQEATGLEAFWVKNGRVVSRQIVTDELVNQGRRSAAGAVECHAANTSAFASYGWPDHRTDRRCGERRRAGFSVTPYPVCLSFLAMAALFECSASSPRRQPDHH
jgi:hypothetical protein